MIRLNKYLAQCNLGSRRKADEYIANGDVKVNGSICTDLGIQIDPDKDVIHFQNKPVKASGENIYIMLNKPTGYIVTRSDESNRQTVFHILPDFNVNLFPVGRLDMNSEGLLLLTNDGDTANKILHPRYKLPKTYTLLAKGKITDEQIEMLKDGIVIEDKKTLPAKVWKIREFDYCTELKIVICEGRKRQIRLMIQAIGSQVTKLKRIQIGKIHLGNLDYGKWRFLKEEEIKYLTALE